MAKIGEVILKELREIKEKQVEHTSELKVYNIHLIDHMARTKQLEERMEPVEDHVKFINKGVKAIIMIATIIGAISAVSRLLGR